MIINFYSILKMQCLTSNDDIGKLMEQDCYILFYFTASWCGPCKRILPELEAFYQSILSTKDINIKFYKIDIDENEELCKKWEIMGVPTFILCKKTESLGKLVGADIHKVKALVTRHK